jgi:N-acetylmuramic acid 6-phosphate etherase
LKSVTRNADMELSQLSTEQPNPASKDLDRKSSLEIVRILNAEDAKVAAAVKPALPQIARAIDVIANAIKNHGRLIYVGTGTSGRIAALDAAEIPPTFGINPKTVQFIIAGGVKALGEAVEANEDSREFGEQAIARKKPGRNDVVVGIAASGRTPFTIAAVQYAHGRGARTIAVTCNPNSQLGKSAEIEIVVEVGPEAISGSTRMKSGTAQKMVLNMLSSGAMTKLGYVYGNLMINVRMKNHKLAERAATVLQQAVGIDREAAKQALKSSGNSVPIALVMLKAKVSKSSAQQALKSTAGNVRQAINAAKSI